MCCRIDENEFQSRQTVCTIFDQVDFLLVVSAPKIYTALLSAIRAVIVSWSILFTVSII